MVTEGKSESVPVVSDTNESSTPDTNYSSELGGGPEEGKGALNTAPTATNDVHQVEAALVEPDPIQNTEKEAGANDLNEIVQKGDDKKPSSLQFDGGDDSKTKLAPSMTSENQITKALSATSASGNGSVQQHEGEEPPQSKQSSDTSASPIVTEPHQSMVGEPSQLEQAETKESSPNSQPIRYPHLALGSTDFEEPASTWESKGRAGYYASASSFGDTITRGGDESTFVNGALSPNNQSTTWGSTTSRGETFSPTSSCNTFSQGMSTSDSSYLYSSSRTNGTSTFSPRASQSATDYSELSPSNDTADHDDVSKGGRMWRAAEIHAKNSKDRQSSPRTKKFADSIVARTRSRADTDTLLTNVSSLETTGRPPIRMIDVNAQEEGEFIKSTSIARKRERVVQLLTIGLLSFLIAFLGGFLVMASCHFVSVSIKDESNGKDFDLHFGLWKYSPLDSAYQGYSYCNHYDGNFISQAPWIGRISSLVSLLGGGFSLTVLWLYLVLGKCVQNMWTIAIYSAALSGALELSTLSIFFGPICSEDTCKLGPGGAISIVAGCFYFVLAFEMHYNTPLVHLRDNSIQDIPSREEPHRMVANLEMTDFEYGAKAYVQRIAFGEANPYPTLNQIQRDASNHQRMGEAMMERKNGSYKPPPVYV